MTNNFDLNEVFELSLDGKKTYMYSDLVILKLYDHVNIVSVQR
jgi:hypothetical protein